MVGEGYPKNPFVEEISSILIFIFQEDFKKDSSSFQRMDFSYTENFMWMWSFWWKYIQILVFISLSESPGRRMILLTLSSDMQILQKDTEKSKEGTSRAVSRI